MQTLKNKTFYVSIQCLVRKPLSLERGALTLIEWGILKILIKFIEENKKAFVFIKYGLLKLFMVGYSVGFSCFFLGLV